MTFSRSQQGQAHLVSAKCSVMYSMPMIPSVLRMYLTNGEYARLLPLFHSSPSGEQTNDEPVGKVGGFMPPETPAGYFYVAMRP